MMITSSISTCVMLLLHALIPLANVTFLNWVSFFLYVLYYYIITSIKLVLTLKTKHKYYIYNICMYIYIIHIYIYIYIYMYIYIYIYIRKISEKQIPVLGSFFTQISEKK